MYSAALIAELFVKKGIETEKWLTQMKLHKVIFFAHGLHLAQYDCPLINEEFKAWQYGPVVADLYPLYKEWGSSPITKPSASVEGEMASEFEKLILGANQSEYKNLHEVVNDTWDITQDLTAGQMSNWTHKEGSPWTEAYKKHPTTGFYYVESSDFRGAVITNDSIKSYFLSHVITVNKAVQT